MPAGPSPEFLELRRLAKLWDEAVATRAELLERDPATPAAQARQDEVERQINAVEERVMNKPPGDLLDRAALVLFWSGGGQRGFDAPVEALRRQAMEGDCFESRALLLAASVFESRLG